MCFFLVSYHCSRAMNVSATKLLLSVPCQWKPHSTHHISVQPQTSTPWDEHPLKHPGGLKLRGMALGRSQPGFRDPRPCSEEGLGGSEVKLRGSEKGSGVFEGGSGGSEAKLQGSEEGSVGSEEGSGGTEEG